MTLRHCTSRTCVLLRQRASQPWGLRSCNNVRSFPRSTAENDSTWHGSEAGSGRAASHLTNQGHKAAQFSEECVALDKHGSQMLAVSSDIFFVLSPGNRSELLWHMQALYIGRACRSVLPPTAGVVLSLQVLSDCKLISTYLDHSPGPQPGKQALHGRLRDDRLSSALSGSFSLPSKSSIEVPATVGLAKTKRNQLPRGLCFPSGVSLRLTRTFGYQNLQVSGNVQGYAAERQERSLGQNLRLIPVVLV